MLTEAHILLFTAGGIAFAHTLLGPDHYLVFVAMAKANSWSKRKTLLVTSVCGLGHVLSSVVLGLVGIAFGAALVDLVNIETARGTLAGWGLLAFGLVYGVWGLRRAYRRQAHDHSHRHGDLVHSHTHDHTGDHTHVHESEQSRSMTPWVLFILFVLGPCEALIPMFMYPAAQSSPGLVLLVAVVFGVTTLLTMLLAVTLLLAGLKRFNGHGLSRFAHAIAGFSIVACGAAINFAGI